MIKQFCKEKLYIDHANLGWFIVEDTACFLIQVNTDKFLA